MKLPGLLGTKASSSSARTLRSRHRRRFPPALRGSCDCGKPYENPLITGTPYLVLCLCWVAVQTDGAVVVCAAYVSLVALDARTRITASRLRRCCASLDSNSAHTRTQGPGGVLSVSFTFAWVRPPNDDINTCCRSSLFGRHGFCLSRSPTAVATLGIQCLWVSTKDASSAGKALNQDGTRRDSR